jgi:hypothetical protein
LNRNDEVLLVYFGNFPQKGVGIQTVSEAPLSSVVRLNIIVAAFGALQQENDFRNNYCDNLPQAGHNLKLKRNVLYLFQDSFSSIVKLMRLEINKIYKQEY